MSYKMLDCKLDIYPDLIGELFNNILETGKYPIEWVTSLITPIHKTGSTSDPNNYTMSCKIFLLDFAVKNSQLGASEIHLPHE